MQCDAKRDKECGYHRNPRRFITMSGRSLRNNGEPAEVKNNKPADYIK